MDNQQLDDLKQFIEARLSQTEQRIKDELQQDIRGVKNELQQDIERVRTEMHDGFSGVGDAVDEINKRIDEHSESDDQRLTRLEQQPA